jgi:hypothetical protein
MSGVYCGGCGEGSLRVDPAGTGAKPVVCDLCGWTYDDVRELPREWRVEHEPWTKRQRKKAGKLFFLWVHTDPAAGRAIFDVMGVLGLDSVTSSGTGSLIELDAAPSEETQERLRAVTGVTKVWLVP